MARNFTPTTDKINFGSDARIDDFTSLTFACWIYVDAFTTAAGGRLYGKNKSLNVTDNGIGGRNKNLQFFAPWSGDDGEWYTATDSITTGAWTHVAVTYNGSATTNDPVFYINGAVSTTFEQVAPTGTLDADAGTDFLIGNNSTNIRGFDGSIAEAGYWNRILNAAEIYSLSRAFAPSFYRNGLKLYPPLIGTASPEPNLMGTGNGTLTGTVRSQHPRIIYPR